MQTSIVVLSSYSIHYIGANIASDQLIRQLMAIAQNHTTSQSLRCPFPGNGRAVKLNKTIL